MLHLLLELTELKKLKESDLQIPFILKTFDSIEVIYNRWQDKLILKGNLIPEDSAFWITNGKITSIPDLINGQIIVHFSNIDSNAIVKPNILLLKVDELYLGMNTNLVKLYKRNNEIYFDYKLENSIRNILAIWQEE